MAAMPAWLTRDDRPDFGHCFACGRRLRREGHVVFTADGQAPWVGPECLRKIRVAGAAGWPDLLRKLRAGMAMAASGEAFDEAPDEAPDNP